MSYTLSVVLSVEGAVRRRRHCLACRTAGPHRPDPPGGYTARAAGAVYAKALFYMTVIMHPPGNATASSGSWRIQNNQEGEVP
jgi:hypothetical protein